MIREHIIHHLIEKARRERDAATARRLRARQAHTKAAGTLESLENFRKEHDRARATPDGRTDRTRLRVHLAFGGKLDEAIGVQRKEAASIEEALKAREADLTAAQRRLKAIELLERRRRRAALRREEQADQRAQDDLATVRTTNEGRSR